MPPATFSHWFHRIRFTCSVCHPDLFPMKEVAKGITHDAMTEGKFCAACHAGKISWAISLDNCKRCHVPQ